MPRVDIHTARPLHPSPHAAALSRRCAEARCIAQAAAGDAQAFATLVRLHQSRVRQQLRRLVRGDHALADNLAQETFVQAWQHLPAFRREARFSTWLHRIAYRHFLMHARSAPEATEELVDEPADARPHDAALRLDVEAAVARLPDAERIALIHCHLLDLSHEEAAQVLALPLGTLKSQVARAKARLRDALVAWQPERLT